MNPSPHLLCLEPDRVSGPTRFVRAGAASLAAHALFLLLLIALPRFQSAPEPHAESVEVKRAARLVAPPPVLTQREPNRTKVAKEIRLENLLPSPPKARFHAPPRSTPPPSRAVAPALPKLNEPPKIEAFAKAQPLPQAGVPAAPPPPQIQEEEKPKLAFQKPGASGVSQQPSTGPLSKLTPPRNSVDEAIRSVARSGGAGMTVGDILDEPSPAELHQRPAPGLPRSQIELLSDPQGVDFKPYLIRVLSAVKRNWFAVIPESAHLGRHGRVQLIFAIDRGGKVPKLVISLPSGAGELDRAAVAGVSASIPFPPLPPEFRGDQIRLQLSFQYN